MQAPARPPVSICLLTYNRADVLRRSLDSLLAQTYTDFELIINDDCSSDDTAGIAGEYAEKDGRIRYYRRNEKNLRYAGNQNAAVARARCELVAIVHDGDVYRADCVSKWVAAMEVFPTVGIVFNASDALDEKGKITVQHRHPYANLIPGKEMIDEMLKLYASPIFGIVMVRKSLLLKAGPFSERFPVLADVDMWMRLLPSFRTLPTSMNHFSKFIHVKPTTLIRALIGKSSMNTLRFS